MADQKEREGNRTLCKNEIDVPDESSADFQSGNEALLQINENNNQHLIKRLQDEIHMLKQQLHRDDNRIPEALWNMFPQSGQYLKNIMKSSGYETIESILKLRYREELNKMFDFIKSVSDIIEDKEEMFGVFKSNPNKVTLIPGLEPTLKKFIDAVENYSRSVEDGNKFQSEQLTPQNARRTSKVVQAVKVHDTTETRNELQKRIENWLLSQPLAIERLNELGIPLASSFSITGVGLDYQFHCAFCKTTIALMSKENGHVSCSNAYKHLAKVCWMNKIPKDPATRKLVQGKRKISMDNLVPPTYERCTERCSFFTQCAVVNESDEQKSRAKEENEDQCVELITEDGNIQNATMCSFTNSRNNASIQPLAINSLTAAGEDRSIQLVDRLAVASQTGSEEVYKYQSTNFNPLN